MYQSVPKAASKNIAEAKLNFAKAVDRAYKRLVDGRMEVSAVSEDAIHLVLLRGYGTDRQELARRELHLVPGEVLEVRIGLE